MDNIRIGISNCKIERDVIKGWAKINPDRVFASPNNRFLKNSIFTNFEVYNVPTNDQERKKYPAMEVVYVEKDGNGHFRIKNSIRKWYFGSVSTQELNAFQFMECMQTLSSILSLGLKFFMKMKNFKLEYGRTFFLPLSGQSILLNAFEHPDFKNRRNYVKEGSLYFNAINSGIIIYDKAKQLKDSNDISRNSYSRLTQNKSLIRMELDINKVSGVQYVKEHFSTIQDLFDNWDLLHEYWQKQMLKIIFIDFLTQKEFEVLLQNQKGIFYKYLMVKGCEYLGFDKIIMLLDTTIRNDKNKKYKVKKYILDTIKEMESHKDFTTQKFVKALILNAK